MITKHFKVSILLLLFSSVCFSQKAASPVKQPQIGFSVNAVDFSASVPRIGKLDPGFSLLYWQGVTSKIDYSVRYNGLFSDYMKNPETSSANGYINEFEGSLHGRILRDNCLLNPFLTAGIGIGNYGKKQWAPYVPLGGGLQLNMAGEGYIFLQANYRRSLSENKLDHNMFYSLGFTQTLGKVKEHEVLKPVPVVEEVKDSDNDGIADISDQCPDVPGLTALQGCPDKDSDGIADREDQCPERAGTVKNKGCPVPDTDSDGINDEQDKCPSVAGVAKYEGCPIPDKDGDGVNDEEDQCPERAGTAANKGCPEVKQEVKARVEKAAGQIYFASGSDKLLAKSFTSLNDVAKELQADADLRLNIQGHTDNTGKAEKNQILSEARAKAVYDYLVQKGVSENQLSSTGFGQTQPVADNKTASGRARNRRVELHLSYTN